MHGQKVLLLLASLLACTLAAEFLNAEWRAWKAKHERKYESPEEDVLRRGVWEGNWKMVTEHNKMADQGNKSYWMAMNHFADRTMYELQSMSCFNIPTIQPQSVKRYSGERLQSLPAEVDWRDSDCITGIKNQGQCGSCWAFAAVGALESRYCIKTGELVDMSEQELVDCDQKDGGCCGGFPYDAYRFIAENGIMATKHYKYKGYGGECRFKNKKAISMNMSKFYQMDDEENMAAAVANDGPVTVGFGVSMGFFFLSEGIYDDDCASDPNHAIILVGYGSQDHEEYWIIKNSWGEDWGDNGYAKVRRNVNKCNIGDMGAAMDLE